MDYKPPKSDISWSQAALLSEEEPFLSLCVVKNTCGPRLNNRSEDNRSNCQSSVCTFFIKNADQMLQAALWSVSDP